MEGCNVGRRIQERMLLTFGYVLTALGESSFDHPLQTQPPFRDTC